MYADYEYYASEYLQGLDEVIPDDAYNFWEKKARLVIDRATSSRIKALSEIPEEVKDCTCAVAEVLYKGDVYEKDLSASGLAGPLVSWSNDGESGSVDLSHASYATEEGRSQEIRRLLRLYLGDTGLLFMGVVDSE